MAPGIVEGEGVRTFAIAVEGDCVEGDGVDEDFDESSGNPSPGSDGRGDERVNDGLSDE